MKDKQKTKPTKKRILTYYLILAASLLVIAAIAVGVVFGVQPRKNPVIDSGQTEQPTPDDGNKPDDGNNPPPVIDTSTKYEFITPVKAVTVSQTHYFWHNATVSEYRLHEGMDFACAAGTEVLAAIDGTVKNVFTGHQLYGSWVEIEHENGIKTVYMYVEPTKGLRAGDKLNRGDVIGKVMPAMGLEAAEGDHLHFEVYKNNIMQDPDIYLKLITK